MSNLPGKPTADTAATASADDMVLIQQLREQHKAEFDPGTVLLFGGARYASNDPLMVRVERYLLTDGSGRPSRPGSEPVLTIEFVTLVDESNTAVPLVWSEKRQTKTWRDFKEYRTWLPFDGDLATQQARARALLETGIDPQLTQQLRLLETEEDTQSASTALLSRRDKAFYETELETSRRLQQQAVILQHLMQVEIERRMAGLNAIKAQAGAVVAAFQKKIEGLVRTITVIELYLGVEEELHQIRSGRSAPADSPIRFRQAVMYMDEEVAVHLGFQAARNFDFARIEQFDEWLLQPGNLDVVLPEPRSIAVFHPRRRAKRYEDGVWYDGRNEKNRHFTYFLIRDGENLHRIFTHKLVVGERLFPKRTELQGMFDEFNAARTEREKESLEDTMYVYRRLSTFLQGLLDRTTVFGSLASPINLFHLTERTERLVEFIYDADDNLLADGRPAFWQWARALNEQIAEGSRVLVTGDYGQYAHHRRDFASRLFYSCNEYSVPPLPQRGVYVVESTKGLRDKQLFILYLPGDTVYGSWGDYDPHPRKKRVGWKIDPANDRFILHYDPIQPDEVRYYLRDRIHRQEYSDMLPVLESILALKQEESQQESPFVQMVLDEGIRRSLTITPKLVQAAVIWWKTKNKWKRPLSIDDTKAYRMILAYLNRSQADQAGTD